MSDETDLRLVDVVERGGDDDDSFPSSAKGGGSSARIPSNQQRPDHLSRLILQERRSIAMTFDDKVEEERTEVIETSAGEELLAAYEAAISVAKDDTSFYNRNLRRASRRVSNIWSCASRKRRVEVRLLGVSCHVPVKVFGPSIRTVLNQSICYVVFDFFRRVHLLCQRDQTHKNTNLSGTGNAMEATTENNQNLEDFEDVVSPYRKEKILHDVNLVFQCGKSYLILGPPGCGKTTLLKTIAGQFAEKNRHDEQEGKKQDKRDRQTHVTGRIEYNGVTVKEDPTLILPSLASFVGQLDNHAPYLTVKETFDFAFQCRAGGQHSHIGITNSTEAVKLDQEHFTENMTIDGLGLGHVGDTFVGNAAVRGVSGGQRRRVTVGEMMQGHAPVACADEISTGLDATSTYEIVKSMVCFAKATGTTRIVSLLQPGPETFSLFDEVIVLSEGHVIYSGPIGNVLEYFAGLGYVLPATMDVADFLQAVSTPDGVRLFRPTRPGEEHYTSERFSEAFRSSPFGQEIVAKLKTPHPFPWSHPQKNEQNQSSTPDDVESTGATRGKGHDIPREFKVEFQNSFSRSVLLNIKRHFTLWIRDLGFIIGKTMENLLMGITTGGMLFGTTTLHPQESAEANANEYLRLFACVFGAMFQAMFHISAGTMSVSPNELDERTIFYKHANANFYHTFSFLIGRAGPSLFQQLMNAIAFGTPLYWMVGLVAAPGEFFTFIAILFGLMCAMTMLFSIFAAFLPDKSTVQGVGIFVVFLSLLFGGFIVYPIVIPNYYMWLYWINPVAWAYQGLLSNEFTSDKYAASMPGMKGSFGSTILSSSGFQEGKEWIGYTFAFLIPFTVLGATISGVLLKYLRVTGRTKLSKGDSAGDTDAIQSDDDDMVCNLPFAPVDVTFEGVSYEVKASTGDKTIKLLNRICGVFSSGRMCALMGESGAGKTTLMDVIALRKTTGTVTGEVRLNGFLQERISFLRCSGYVEQFDIQAPELTVRETVAFSARLRLDSKIDAIKDDAGKMRFVDSVIKMLELTSIQNEQVGNYESGFGLTFEQRKRLSIAVELAGSPAIIFLDEPTSGLDARAALLVMRLLKKIADTGRTVCATIHQPSSAVFDMFDDLLLLKRGGEAVFFGETGPDSVHLIDYFESHGAAPIEHGENPASWMLKVLEEEKTDVLVVNWVNAYKSSKQWMELMDKIQAAGNETQDEKKKISYDDTFAAPMKERTRLMNRRINTIYMRSPAYNLSRLVVSVLYAFLLASIFFHNSYRDHEWTTREVDGILGTIFLSLIIMGVTSVNMVMPVMMTIRDVFYKHRACGMLDHRSLTVALGTGESAYICLVSFLFTVVYYVSIGLFVGKVAIVRFIFFWGYFTFNLSIYSFFGQAFMCLFKDLPTAGALSGAFIGYNVFFSGLIVRPQYFNSVFAIGYWTAPTRYAYEGIVTTQFEGMNNTVVAERGEPFYYYLNCEDYDFPCTGTLNEYVHFFYGGKFKLGHFWLGIVVLTFFCGGARLATYFGLKWFNHGNT